MPHSFPRHASGMPGRLAVDRRGYARAVHGQAEARPGTGNETLTLPPEGAPPDAPDNVIGHLDAWQRKHSLPAFLVAIVKKYGDDGGGRLVALLTFYGFLSLFPLLLVFITVLGFVLEGRPGMQDRILSSTLAQFPILGDQLRQNVHSLTGNPFALVVGLATSLWGGLGVTQAAQEVLATVWGVPRRDRPGFVPRLLRGLGLLALLVGVVLTTAVLTSVAAAITIGWPVRVVMVVVSVAINVWWFALAWRVLTPGDVTWRQALPGSIVAAAGWQVLLVLGSALVRHQLQGASASYGLFGLVLGLIGWITLVATLLVYAAEVSAVVAHRLWPRSLFTPALTPADRTVMAQLSHVEARAPHEAVEVRYVDEA